MAHRRGLVNAELRENFMQHRRLIAELQVRLGMPGAKAELERLEAGGTAVVAGWLLGWATDFGQYDLAGDGTITPHVYNRLG